MIQAILGLVLLGAGAILGPDLDFRERAALAAGAIVLAASARPSGSEGRANHAARPSGSEGRANHAARPSGSEGRANHAARPSGSEGRANHAARPSGSEGRANHAARPSGSEGRANHAARPSGSEGRANHATRRPGARAVAAMAAALLLANVVPVLWQVSMAIAVGLVAALGRWSPDWRAPGAWARGGWSWPGVSLCAGVTPVALIGWMLWAKPDLSGVLQAYLLPVPLWVLALGGVGVVLVNASLEELIWRGVILVGLERAGMRPALAVVVQALSFGVAHAHGVPRGPVGMLLAGIWALMLGVLRVRTGGLGAVIVAHVVADAVVAGVVLARS